MCMGVRERGHIQFIHIHDIIMVIYSSSGLVECTIDTIVMSHQSARSRQSHRCVISDLASLELQPFAVPRRIWATKQHGNNEEMSRKQALSSVKPWVCCCFINHLSIINWTKYFREITWRQCIRQMQSLIHKHILTYPRTNKKCNATFFLCSF